MKYFAFDLIQNISDIVQITRMTVTPCLSLRKESKAERDHLEKFRKIENNVAHH